MADPPSPSVVVCWACIVFAVALYVAALAGLVGADPTPPLDVGATSTLVLGLLFGVLGLALSRRPAA